MKKFHHRIIIAMLVAILAASTTLGAARAISDSPAQTAESIRSSLVQAQLGLIKDSNTSTSLVIDAEKAYQTGLSGMIAISDPDAHSRILSAFKALIDSISRGDPTS